jgi:lipid-A-disaccharide synthase
MHIFFSAGEPSGDQHAAQLMQQLRQRDPHLRMSGFGGPEMAREGLETLYPLAELAVMGITAIIPLLWRFWKLYRQAAAFLKTERPDAVLLIDYPGFNWWIAAAARRAGVPVYYYCPPQLWAWAGWRIRKVRKYVDCILSVLPFEAEWYRSRGVNVAYVGHPFFDEVAAHTLDSTTLEVLRKFPSPRVAILPGSRKQEVNRNFPVMLDVVAELHERHPEVRFAVACYKPWHHDRCRELLAEDGRNLPLDLYMGKTPEVIEAADCCLMVSGSVSLELLARKKPAVVLYRAGLLMGFFAHLLVSCKYMTLPNLIANRLLMPEFSCLRRRGPHVKKMVRILDTWLSDPAALEACRKEVAALADQVVQSGGIVRAAEELFNRVDAETRTGEWSLPGSKQAA